MPPSLPGIGHGIPPLPLFGSRGGGASALMDLRASLTSPLFLHIQRGGGPDMPRSAAALLSGNGTGPTGILPPGHHVATSAFPFSAPGQVAQPAPGSPLASLLSAAPSTPTHPPGALLPANAAPDGRPSHAGGPLSGNGHHPSHAAQHAAHATTGAGVGASAHGPLGHVVSTVASTAGQALSVAATVAQALLGRSSPTPQLPAQAQASGDAQARHAGQTHPASTSQPAPQHFHASITNALSQGGLAPAGQPAAGLPAVPGGSALAAAPAGTAQLALAPGPAGTAQLALAAAPAGTAHPAMVTSGTMALAPSAAAATSTPLSAGTAPPTGPAPVGARADGAAIADRAALQSPTAVPANPAAPQTTAPAPAATAPPAPSAPGNPQASNASMNPAAQQAVPATQGADARGNTMISGTGADRTQVRSDGPLPQGHTVERAQRGRMRALGATVLAALGQRSDEEIRIREQADATFRWLYWALTITAWLCLVLLAAAVVPVFNAPGTTPAPWQTAPGTFAGLAGLGICAGLAAWLMARRQK